MRIDDTRLQSRTVGSVACIAAIVALGLVLFSPIASIALGTMALVAIATTRVEPRLKWITVIVAAVALMGAVAYVLTAAPTGSFEVSGVISA